MVPRKHLSKPQCRIKHIVRVVPPNNGEIQDEFHFFYVTLLLSYL